MPRTESEGQRAVTIRNLLSDTLIYGVAGVANRAIGFLLLPITTALLDPADYGVLGLFGATASILWLLVSAGVPSAFYRFYAETDDAHRRSRLVGSALLLCLLQSVAALGLMFLFGQRMSNYLFGIPAIWPTGLLVGNAICTTLIALGTGRLQADGHAWRFLYVNLATVFCSRGISLALLLLGYGPWGWITGELVGLGFSLPLLAVLAWPRGRPSIRLATMGGTFWYGLLLTPAFLSQWLMVGCDKLIMKGVLASPEEAIGFYSVGERISSIVMFSNLAFALAWRRFAFRNMALTEGRPLLARGLKLFILGSGLLAMALALLGDDLTHWMIRAEFAPGMVVIIPLTIAGWFAGLADTTNVGMHRANRPSVISVINVAAAVLNVALNLWAIPRFGILGAASATLIAQAVRLTATWWVSQAMFAIPLDYAGTGLALGIFALVASGAYFAGRSLVVELPGPWGWSAATVFQLAAVMMAVAGVWVLPVFDDEERDAIRRLAKKILKR